MHVYAKRNTHVVGNVSVMVLYLGTVATLNKLDTTDIDVSWVTSFLLYFDWGIFSSGPEVIKIMLNSLAHEPDHVPQSVARLTQEPQVLGSITGPTTYFRFSLR